MDTLPFTRNESPTLGVEVELQLVDPQTGALKSAIQDVLNGLPESLRGPIKPELMQCYLEINTDVCRSVREAGEDVRGKIAALEKVTDKLGLRLLWAGTHPFSSWRD